MAHCAEVGRIANLQAETAAGRQNPDPSVQRALGARLGQALIILPASGHTEAAQGRIWAALQPLARGGRIKRRGSSRRLWLALRATRFPRERE